jgi:hypothetical protein
VTIIQPMHRGPKDPVTLRDGFGEPHLGVWTKAGGVICLYELGSARKDEDDNFWIPPEALAAFAATGDPLPLIDWVLENTRPQPPWLVAALARLRQEPVTGNSEG